MDICLVDKNETFWLYRVEEAILTVEVKPTPSAQVDSAAKSIGQVVLKRLMGSEQVLERLASGQTMCQLKNIQSVAL